VLVTGIDRNADGRTVTMRVRDASGPATTKMTLRTVAPDAYVSIIYALESLTGSVSSPCPLGRGEGVRLVPAFETTMSTQTCRDRALSGRHAVVTGASRGIGAATAARLAAHGARLTLMGRNAPALEACAGALGDARAMTVDVLDADAVCAAFAKAAADSGPIDVLVNNAGAADSAPLARTDARLWQYLIDVNLTSVYRCTHAVLPGMVARDWGRIVNVASTAGLKGYAYVSAYCAAKHGVIGFTRSLALETARKNVTVNAVCPGYTQTSLLEEALDKIVAKTGSSRAEAQADLRRANPQNRFIRPDEVAAAIAWLCLPGTESITGQALAIAGGEVM
jgi:NAD(P)-dependent dehydrogenase (short-subunit alcohol dehydrogenase family)